MLIFQNKQNSKLSVLDKYPKIVLSTVIYSFIKVEFTALTLNKQIF